MCCCTGSYYICSQFSTYCVSKRCTFRRKKLRSLSQLFHNHQHTRESSPLRWYSRNCTFAEIQFEFENFDTLAHIPIKFLLNNFIALHSQHAIYIIVLDREKKSPNNTIYKIYNCIEYFGNINILK